jgi:2-amino-4-hydroxy-6-hydroxymethyldihydropteridine diphosphokinase
MAVAYIGLGSNLGDSQALLQEAVEGLRALGPVRPSRLYASTPMGPQDQPDYLNAVVRLETALPPLALLDALQHLEQLAGRRRLRHWGERTLDLDLLLWDDLQLHTERLTVPHAGLLLRNFVIQPLLDLDPTLSVLGQSLAGLALARDRHGIRPIQPKTWADVTSECFSEQP